VNQIAPQASEGPAPAVRAIDQVEAELASAHS
jgi:hypothetical protein